MEFVSVKEAASQYGCSEQTIRNLIRKGVISAVRLSPKTTRIDLFELRNSMKKVAADKVVRKA